MPWPFAFVRHILCSSESGRVAVHTLRFVLVAFALTVGGVAAHAQTAVTATCKDGTSYSGPSRRGACARHGGVQAYGATDTAAPATQSTPAAPVKSTPAPAATAPTPRSSATVEEVWVNTSTKVYHCPGDRYYGKTKAGSYMTEAAAKAAGDRPSRGKTCS